MSDYTTKSQPVFLAPSDELRFENELKSVHPGVRFVDGTLWDGPSPPIQTNLASCRPRTVLLWDTQVFSTLPCKKLDNGRFQGPVTVYVIRYIRSRVQDNVLLSGDFGVGYEKSDASMTTFVKDAWRILKSLNAGILDCYNPDTNVVINSGITDYVVGPGAVKLSQTGTPLKHLMTDVYYRARDRVSAKSK